MGTTTVELHPGPPEPGVGQFDPGTVTEAVLSTRPSASTAVAGKGSAASVTTEIVTVPPTAIVPRLHVMLTPPGGPQTAGVDETKVSPAGRVSDTVTFASGTGPVLVTV